MDHTLTRPRYEEHLPGAALAPWVWCYWTIRGAAGAPALVNRILPDGCADVIVDLAAAGGPHAIAVGAMRTAAVVTVSGTVNLFGVRFRPGGALPFAGGPLSELTDRRAPLDALWGALGSALGSALAEAAGAPARVAAAEQVLAARLHTAARDASAPGADLARRAAVLVRASRGRVGVRALAGALGVGERRLARAFDQAVGLTPKALCRIERFRAAVARIDAAPPGAPPRWSPLAYAAGYADHAHFTREFRALAGITPSQYAAERARRVRFVQELEPA